jgi:hypothetical protein
MTISESFENESAEFKGTPEIGVHDQYYSLKYQFDTLTKYLSHSDEGVCFIERRDPQGSRPVRLTYLWVITYDYVCRLQIDDQGTNNVNLKLIQRKCISEIEVSIVNAEASIEVFVSFAFQSDRVAILAHGKNALRLVEFSEWLITT